MEPTRNKIGQNLETLIRALYPGCRIYVREDALLRYSKAAKDKGLRLIHARGVPQSTMVRAVSPKGKLLARIMNNGEIKQEQPSMDSTGNHCNPSSDKDKEHRHSLPSLESGGIPLRPMESERKSTENPNVSSEYN